MQRRLFALSLLFAAPAGAGAVDLPDPPRFTVIEVDPLREPLQLFWCDEHGQPFKRFGRLVDWLRQRGQRLRFGMNAGMFHADFSPVGLLVQDGVEVAPVNSASGVGNFFLKPNGVFFVDEAGPHVMETSRFAARAGPPVRLATQSGPMLLERGRVHAAFSPTSVSRLIRNGVGVSGGKAFFAITDAPVNLHEFAVFFRDGLGCADALYLDGSVSSLYSQAHGRSDWHAALGPIFGLTD